MNKISEKGKGIGLLLLSLVILLSYSCEFEPNKVYERTVNENVAPPEITVVELNLDYDTIYLYYDKLVNFSFTSNNQGIKAVRFIIDDIEKTLVNANNGVYYLEFEELSDGAHTLVLEVHTVSGTGSIAESIGAEGYIFSKSWVLVVDRSYISGLKPGIQDGFLKFSWHKYRGYNFKEYIIYRWIQWDIRTEIARTTSLSFIDSTYVGEGTKYDVEVSTQEGNSLLWGFLELANELPKISFFASESNDYIFKWNKSRYYNAVDSFKLDMRYGYSGIYTEVKSTRNSEDTTYNVTTAIFGDNVSLKLKLVPKNNILYSPVNYPRFESLLDYVLLGFSFKPRVANYRHVAQVNQDEFIYILGCDSLVRYSVSQKRVVERLGYKTTGCSMCNFIDFKVSASGKYLTTYVDCTHDVMLTNSGNLGNKIIRNLQYLSGQYFTPGIPVSDAGTGVVHSSLGGFYLYNFNSSSSLGFYKYKAVDGQGLEISVDGGYIFIKDDSLRLVHFNNSEFINIWSQSRYNELRYYGFDGINPDRFVIWDGSMFSVKLCSDFSDNYEFSLTDDLILNIDYYNNEMLTYLSGHLFVRNLTDGSLLKDIPTHLDPTNWYYSCILVNHAVICLAGVIYFIK